MDWLKASILSGTLREPWRNALVPFFIYRRIMNVTNTYELYFDGACLPNPGGVASFGFVLYLNGEEIDKGHGIIGRGKYMTDVVAEYKALAAGLNSFIRLFNKPGAVLKIYSDSQFVVSQVKKQIHESLDLQIIEFHLREIQRMVSVYLSWIPREQNKRADELAKMLRSCMKN